MTLTYQSTCGFCSRAGVVSPDQGIGRGGGKAGTALKAVRFFCSCGNVWLVDRDQAENHTRWLDQAGLA